MKAPCGLVAGILLIGSVWSLAGENAAPAGQPAPPEGPVVLEGEPPAPSPEADAPVAGREGAPGEPVEEPGIATGQRPKAPPTEGLTYEVSGAFDYLLPSASDWDSAYGVEARFRWWKWGRWGLGAELGYTEWTYAEGRLDIGATPAFKEVSVEGDSTTYPVTLSGCYRRPLGRALEFVADLGVRYLFVDSEVGVIAFFHDHRGRDVHYATFVKNVDKLMGVLGAELSGGFLKRGFWNLGLDYQLEIGSSDPNWLMEDVANDYDALVLRAGAGYEW